MQYRNNKKGEPISLLGYGCMRFTKNGNTVDLDKAEKEVMAAIEAGVNYFDTAYLYPGNEVAVGEIMARNNCREKINIATKLPQYLIKTAGAIDRYFDEELKRLQTDYVDYYLMHMLTDVAAWEKLKRLGIEEWIAKKKESGQIRHIGFSFHGNSEKFLEILDAYDWDFCQIQYNYIDENTQAGRVGLQAAAKKGIPVIIMEPLRGGRLVGLLPESAKEIIRNHSTKRSAAEWAFRWLMEQPEVTCVLSGMNSMEMVQENVRIASEVEENEFTDEDRDMIEKIKQEINRTIKVNCTACQYCMPCPKGVDIPGTFRCYNEIYTEGSVGAARREYLQNTILQKQRKDAFQCVDCGKCEQHCPQNIQIRQHLKEARKQLLPLHYRIAVKIVRLFKFW